METLETYFEDGKLNERFNVIRDGQNNLIKDGKYEKFYASGKKECDGEYIENLKFGNWKFWYENGDLKEEGEYFNDEKSDTWKTYPCLNKEVQEDNSKSTIYFTKKKQTKTLFIVVGSISLLVILIVLYIFGLRKGDVNETAEIKKTELEEDRKTQEIKLNETKKEKWEELKNNNSGENRQNDEQIAGDLILNKLNSLIKETKQKKNEIRRFYADDVNYYKGGLISANKVMKDKISFFNRWDRIDLTIDNIKISRINNNKYVCYYDKNFLSESFSPYKSYSGKVKSYLIFEYIGGEWLITTENDEKIYYTNKN